MYEEIKSSDLEANGCNETQQSVSDCDTTPGTASDRVVCDAKTAKLEKSIVLHKEALELLSE